MTKPKHWPQSTDGVGAVGESFHREALHTVAQNPPNRSALTYFAATLFPEATNQHDANAVAVRFEDVTVAYLSREDALLYRSTVGATITTADAIITGGFNEGQRQRDYSVELLLEFESPPQPGSRQRPWYSEVVRSDSTPRVSESPEDGLVTVTAPYVSADAAAACRPGVPLKAWTNEEIDDIHFFAPGPIGGAGRVAVLSKRFLAEVGFSGDSIPVVCFAGRNGVAFEFRTTRARTLAPSGSRPVRPSQTQASKSLAWHLGRQIGRLLRRGG